MQNQRAVEGRRQGLTSFNVGATTIESQPPLAAGCSSAGKYGLLWFSTLLLAVCCSPAAPAQTSSNGSKDDFPPHAKILEGYTKVVSKANITPMYTLYTREKDGQMYAELPRTFATKKYYMAMTMASGGRYAGLQNADLYVYWRRYDKRLALIQPNTDIRAEGDKEAASSVKRLFTDRLLLDIPIVTIGPGGGPVVDLDNMLINNSTRLFVPDMGGDGYIGTAARTGIFSISTAKAFENNVEIAFEVPSTNGQLKQLHYSISEIPSSSKYKPRVADQRVGFFTTSYSDLARYNDKETRVRYINRWHLEKADPKLKVSPPANPIVFYIEHTTPVRYRRWVRDGILAWNEAFENVGISNAIEVYYQDATSGAHMDKDPEDVNYNFVRWLNNDVGTAIGPSRVNPLTGQILDADIILTDGWIRHYKNQFTEQLPKIAMEGYGPETLAWLAEHPDWDPRVRLASPAVRAQVSAQIAREARLPFAGHPMASAEPSMIGDDEFDGLIGRTSQINGMCLAAEGMSFDLALMKMSLAMLNADDDDDDDGDDKEDDKDDDDKDEKKEDEKKEEKPKEQMLDGMPESFVGPLVAHLVAHEVGHTLGLRHNFKASSIYSFDEINSEKIKGKKQMAGSVMDYIGVNIHAGGGGLQGDFSMTGIGPYDMWAIEYGYTFDDTKKVLARVAEPELAFATDEDTGGPDPLARRYDFSRNPLDYANNQMKLATHHRGRLLTDFVEDGESWDRVRYGYELTLSLQTRSVSMMANWIGGAFVYRDKKGDPNGRKPVEVVPAQQQRDALNFVVNNTFKDEVFGLSPELTQSMGLDKWLDDRSGFSNEATWPIHDRIMGIQASTLTMLMNPTTLKRVYDNETRIPADQDSLTLPELLSTVSSEIWRELENKPKEQFTDRKPMISSLRRNLQREHLERLIDLTLPGGGSSAASRAISMLAAENLRQIMQKIEACQAAGADKHDPYTTAHLSQAGARIQKALDADYILNPSRGGGGGSGMILLFGEDQK
ncbi:MAG: zinc-dependent metalloprotease [Fuerstiella sp.]